MSSPAIVPTFVSGRLRILSPSASDTTEELEREGRAFVSELQEFSATVNSVVESMSSQATMIEAEKLRAIGFRLLAEQEKLQRERKRREVAALIDERGAELARLTVELDSLLKVVTEQKDLISHLQQ